MKEKNDERRIGMDAMKTDIALIKQKSEFIEEKIDRIIVDMHAVKDDLENKEIIGKSSLESHAVQDRWLFGLVMTILIVILGKLIAG